MPEWQTYPLGAVTINHDARRVPVRAPDRRPGRYPYYGASGIVDYVDDYLFDGSYVLLAEDGENLRTRKTPIAFMAIGKFWVNNHAHIVEGNRLANTSYLCYALSRTNISGYLSGSTQPKLTQSAMNRMEIRLPPRRTQDAIVEVLEALDDKIVLNNRIVDVCDHLRALRLHDWINENPDRTDQCPMSSLAKFVNGRAFTKDASGAGRMVIRIAELNSGPGASTVYNDIAVPDAHLARPGDVLFAWSGSLTVARWFRSEAIVNQHIFKVVPAAGVPAWLMFELIRARLSAFQEIAAGKATTMGHIQRHHLDERVAAPAPDGIAELDAGLRSLWVRALSAEQESLALAELRDMLLPRLMSAEIRVRDAKKIVEDAT